MGRSGVPRLCVLVLTTWGQLFTRILITFIDGEDHLFWRWWRLPGNTALLCSKTIQAKNITWPWTNYRVVGFSTLLMHIWPHLWMRVTAESGMATSTTFTMNLLGWLFGMSRVGAVGKLAGWNPLFVA
jgi:hypothetical protein